MPLQQVRRWSCPRGEARAWLSGPSTLHFELRGNVDADVCAGIVHEIATRIGMIERLDVFWDLEHLEGYHPDCRAKVTELLLRHRDRVGSVHALVRSRLVRMGVQVANLALGGLLQTYGSRGEFEIAERKTLGRAAS